MNLLEFENVIKRYRGKEVLSGVSFSIKSGEILGLVGRSGGGKSTLLKILIGMIRADGGKILFEGKNTLKKENYLKKNTGFATQENMLFDELTIRENSFYFGSLYGMKKRTIKERLKELLDLLKLNGFENTQINQLSGGMAKRANLLVSLIHNPKLLILDEPTVGLDPALRNSLWAYIQKINKAGTTILVTSHLLEEIEENCNRIAILKNGVITSAASVEEYKNRYGKHKSFNKIFQEILYEDI
ncbi:MAG: ABC transporter ATP-binding protein [Candidatus Pacearchaeota archaeon]